MNAPVCPVSRNQPVANMPGIRVPTVPRAVDLASLLAAINAMRQLLPGVAAPLNNMPYGVPNLTPKDAIMADMPDWIEDDRTTKQMRIYHKDDSGKQDQTMYVDVIRLQEVDFTDNRIDQDFRWVQNAQD